MNQTKYTSNGTKQVAVFMAGLSALAASGAGSAQILDSVTQESNGVAMPVNLKATINLTGEQNATKILDSVQRGVEIYTKEHGVAPTADLVEAALQQGYAAARGIDSSGNLLDDATHSGTSSNSVAQAYQSNRAVVATLTALTEAIPFAGYLPVDIGSNQSKLAVLSHVAGTAYGAYAMGEIMDGVNAGDPYASSSRFTKLAEVADTNVFAGKFTRANLLVDNQYCDTTATGVTVLRGRTIVYANGKVAAKDVQSSGSAATSPISGSVRLSGVDYAITGSVTIATGEVNISGTTPTLPADVELVAQGFIDYEAQPALIPSVIVRADTYDIYANPWRVMTSITIDSSTQLKNELGLDGHSEALMAIRAQMQMERHYTALGMVARLGANNPVNYNFDFASRKDMMLRSQILQDFQAVIAAADQKMAEDTMDHGITHIYVPAFFAALCNSMSRDMFEPSGIAARPGIYRVGRLFGKYEIYFSPKVCSQSVDFKTAKLVAVGRSSQVGRNPIMLGDAVAPTFLDLNMTSDLKKQAAMYARDFTVVNPHEPSALGCAIINVSGLTD